jgi:hypothetical protein
MEYNPRFVAFACLWLATKVEEFNVSISEFVENLQPKDQEELTLFEDLILSLELPIIHALKVQALKYKLIIFQIQVSPDDPQSIQTA